VFLAGFGVTETAGKPGPALIAAWRGECLRRPERALILAHDRREVAELNALARAAREAAGLLGAEGIEVGNRGWAVGDRLTCRRNDYRLEVRNGTRGNVVAVERADSSITLRTDEGRIVRLPSAYLPYTEYGYAVTGHVSQGETIDRVYLLAAVGRGGTEWAYVAGSRHRIDLRVYAVGRDEQRMVDTLGATWSQSQAKRLALDLADYEHGAAAFLGDQAARRSRAENRCVPDGAERECLHVRCSGSAPAILRASGDRTAVSGPATDESSPRGGRGHRALTPRRH
jgi:hypothetical protein